MRTYYVSSDVVEHSCYGVAGLDCYIQDKKDCIVETIENDVTITDTEVCRHGFETEINDR